MPQAALLYADPSVDVIEPAPGPEIVEIASTRPTVQETASMSGARGLQVALEERLGETTMPQPGRWSARRTLALVVVSCVTLWGIIVWCAVSLVGALAG